MYNKQYFIDKFRAIPTENIGTASIDNRCAMYHCGLNYDCNTEVLNEEALALAKLFSQIVKRASPFEIIYSVNDGIAEFREFGNTAKERLLNALNIVEDK